jgi:uncharacterized protein YegL
MMTTTFNPGSFTSTAPKPLPVVLLLDTSGSMSGPKIQTLNTAIGKMLNTFIKNEVRETEFLVSVITFGGAATMTIPPSRASEVMLEQLGAGGGTPMGRAVQLAKELIEDKNRTPSRAYRPLVVLVSDGAPTDDWQSPLKDFVASGRSSKCDRMAMGIGEDAFREPAKSMLETFVQGTKNEVFHAEQASEIDQFFKFVTMSTVARSRSVDPNVILPIELVQDTVTPPSESSEKSQEDGQEDSYW